MTRRMLLAAALARRRVAVIAHRGEHLRNPENTLAALESAVAIGCDWVEIDVRRTRDGAYVLMHDARVDRMTNGQGAVADLTLGEIRQLKVKGGGSVPTFDEALAVLRGRCGLYLDAKQIGARDIVAALQRHQMLRHTVVYGGAVLLRELAALGHGRICMPEATDVSTLRGSLAELRPATIAFDARDFQDDVIALARKSRKRIFVDRLGADDTPERWADAVARGATAIQTDRPAELIAWRDGRR